ncbi:hypothetical protein HOD88_00505 [archaeon]|jgi:hypothetical protein|nr:hypothetical protein [archaeon]
MNNKCCGWILPVLIIVFTLWTFSWSMWIVLVAALLILLDNFNNYGSCGVAKTKPVAKKKSAKKRK